MRRTMTVAATAAVALAATASVAMADHTQRLVFGATLLDQPKGQPWAVNLNVNATLGTTDGGLAAPLNHVRLQFPAGAHVNADKFPTRLDHARRYAPQFEALIVKGVGHYLMREDPAAFNAQLARAVARVTGQADPGAHP